MSRASQREWEGHIVALPCRAGNASLVLKIEHGELIAELRAAGLRIQWRASRPRDALNQLVEATAAASEGQEGLTIFVDEAECWALRLTPIAEQGVRLRLHRHERWPLRGDPFGSLVLDAETPLVPFAQGVLAAVGSLNAAGCEAAMSGRRLPEWAPARPPAS
jgi:hypothetical protein